MNQLKVLTIRFYNLRQLAIGSPNWTIRRFSRRSVVRNKHNDNQPLIEKQLAKLGWNATPEPHDLIRPFLFTIGFTAASLSIAKACETSRKSRELNQEKRWQQSGSGAFLPIGLMNLAVFIAWRVRPLQLSMIKYFMASPQMRHSCLPMLLSAFSHISPLHLIANMYVLYSFTDHTVSFMGVEQFYGFYLSAAVIASFASYVSRVVYTSPGFSLGASGAVMSVLGYACTINPDMHLTLFFIPLTIKAGYALAALMIGDVVGLVNRNWKFDHGAHLGGAMFGIFWALVGSKLLWNNAEVERKKKPPRN